MDATSAVLLLSTIPSLKQSLRQPTLFIAELQTLLDLLTKNQVAEKTQMQLLLALELVKIAFELFKKKQIKGPLDDSAGTLEGTVRKTCRVMRPFVYLMLMTVFGRNSKLALVASLILDLGSDNPSWASYLMRSPLFESITMRIVPIQFVRDWLRSYQAYISYII
mmetsp:Transcript_17224/g.30980  ORF Transcript_17224/g.30980 Transcript_17224/m.30980 type:complete len:165 (+) Transcript_17224:4809-5303(+)